MKKTEIEKMLVELDNALFNEFRTYENIRGSKNVFVQSQIATWTMVDRLKKAIVDGEEYELNYLKVKIEKWKESLI